MKDVDYIVQDENEALVFSPKPFVFEDMISPKFTKVYLPGQTYTPFTDGLPLINNPMYMCVHMCEQFLKYPTIKWGIRCIPSGAMCKFGGLCNGAHLMLYGKNTGKSTKMKYQIIGGLDKTQKTR